MARDLPPLAPLVAVDAAARHSSFTKAADSLNLTHGAVSRAVQQAEQALGVPLFHRHSRRVSLTPEGRILADCLERMFSDLRQTYARLRHPATLAVSCEPTLTMRWLMPHLPAFSARHPGISVHLATAGGPIDLSDSGIDLAIRRADFGLPTRGTIRPLCRERVGVVCNPAAWDRWGRTLATAPRLHTRTRPQAWADWSRRSGQPLPPAPSEPVFDHFSFSLQAAVAGLGLAIGPLPLVADDLANGVLVAPFGFCDGGADYIALTVSEPAAGSPAAHFIDWLAASLPEMETGAEEAPAPVT